MDEYQPRGKDANAAGARAGLLVAALGMLLGLVLVCGYLLRTEANRRASMREGDRSTSVAPDDGPVHTSQAAPEDGPGETPGIAGREPGAGDQAVGRADGQPPQARRSVPAAPAPSLPDDSESPRAPPTGAPTDTPTGPENAASPSRSGVSLAELRPLDGNGLGRGPEGLWQPVEISGQRFERALRVVPSGEGLAQINFLLDGKYVALHGVAGLVAAGVDNRGEEPDGGAAIFRIYKDGNLLWESAVLREAGQSESFSLDVQGMEILSLAVEKRTPAAGPQPVWADLRLQEAAND